MAYFNEVFRDMELFQKRLMERMLREMEEIDKAVKSGKLEGGWDIKPIDIPGVKGYVARGRFWSDEPLTPFDLFEPLKPWRRRPMPQRPFNVPESALKEIREPLTDLFEEEKAVKLYVELPGEEKDNIQLNVTEGKVEVKTKNFYKLIDLPTRNVDIEKASSKYKNGVLEVHIPKVKKTATDQKKQKIKIE